MNISFKDFFKNLFSKKKQQTKKVLFVCTGNTCRSPMAAAYFKHICKNNADVDSAALMGRSGNPISPQTKEVLKEENIKLLRNKSKEIDDFDVFSSDIIVPMTQSHKYYLLRDYPKVENKVHTLMSFVGKPLKDIDDPFMKPIKIYQETFDMMKPPLKALCKKLKK